MVSNGLRLPVIDPGPWRRLFSFKPNFLDLGSGALMHYIDHGQGPPVVMVHGNPTWSFMWRALIKDLLGFRRLAPDHVGMGLSSRPLAKSYGFSLEDRIKDLDSFIHSLNLSEPIRLIVHDWGGPIGLGWAARNADKVHSLIIMNSGLRKPPNYQMPFKLKLFKSCNFLGRILAVELNLFVEGLIRVGSLRPIKEDAVRGFLAPYAQSQHREAIGRFLADIPLKSSHRSHEPLKRLEIEFSNLNDKPLLLIWGLGDFVFSRAFLDDFLTLRPEAPALELEQAGHYLLEDEPELITEVIKAFFLNPSDFSLRPFS
ncbi:MAG: alpha/beta fold hydrolase [Deltaproteobacteria bacterium]|jgi:haloalkane dehalogenase|nr:alpha/beta fold hydrolase [Deltaproteobacteria bacterium]